MWRSKLHWSTELKLINKPDYIVLVKGGFLLIMNSLLPLRVPFIVICSKYWFDAQQTKKALVAWIKKSL